MKSKINRYMPNAIKALLDFFSPIFRKYNKNLRNGFIILVLLALLLSLGIASPILYDLHSNTEELYDLHSNTEEQNLLHFIIEYSLAVITIFSLFLCFIAGLVTIRVYFEVKYQTYNLRDYLREITSILLHSDEDDVILIITPTIFFGEETLFEQIQEYRNLLIKKNNLYLTSLKFEYNFSSFIEVALTKTKEVLCKISDEKNTPINCYENDIVRYHYDTWEEYESNNPSQIQNQINLLLAYMKELQKNNAKIITIKKEMYINKTINESYNESEGFFAVANFNKGYYYLGNFIHKRKDVFFYGTSFKNKHIKRQMIDMLFSILKENVYMQDEVKTVDNYKEDVYQKLEL